MSGEWHLPSLHLGAFTPLSKTGRSTYKLLKLKISGYASCNPQQWWSTYITVKGKADGWGWFMSFTVRTDGNSLRLRASCLCAMLLINSNRQRTTESIWAEKTSKMVESSHQFSTAKPSIKPCAPSAPSTHLLSNSGDGDSTTSPASLFQCLTTVSTKIFFSWYPIQPSPGATWEHFLSSCHFFPRRKEWPSSHYSLLSGICREQ